MGSTSPHQQQCESFQYDISLEAHHLRSHTATATPLILTVPSLLARLLLTFRLASLTVSTAIHGEMFILELAMAFKYGTLQEF